jgi:hypothetical protein
MAPVEIKLAATATVMTMGLSISGSELKKCTINRNATLFTTFNGR